MTVLLSVGEELLHSVGRLLSQPFYYIGVLMLLLLYRKQGQQERVCFHVRKRPWLGKWIQSIGGGIVIGMVLSLLFGWIGAKLQLGTIVWLWGIALLLLIFRIRMFSFTYAIAIFILLQSGASYVAESFTKLTWGSASWFTSLLDADQTFLLLLAGVMLGVEAIMYRVQTSVAASPLYVSGKRGKPIGGFNLLRFWPVPLLVLVPAGAASGVELSWTPLLAESTNGWLMLPLPIMLGFNSWTTTDLPTEKARKDARWYLMISIMVIAASLGSIWYPVMAVVGAALLLVLREAVMWKEAQQDAAPQFTHGTDGLKVLDVIVGSPAHQLGIQAGETLYRVNGYKPTTVEELHVALQHNPAYCKLEVTNLQGESKYLKRAIFEGEHHLLGVLLAPNDRSTSLSTKVTDSIWHRKQT